MIVCHIEATTSSSTLPVEYPWFRKTVRVVLQRENYLAFSYMTYRNQYVLPGGGLEDGEEFSECATRECIEELGYRIEPLSAGVVIKEFYDGILRFEHVYLCGKIILPQLPTNHTEEEIYLGLQEVWLPIEEVCSTLTSTYAHLREGEEQPPFMIRAIQLCHIRELLGISLLLNWRQSSSLQETIERNHITVTTTLSDAPYNW